MVFKSGCVFLALLVACFALPLNENEDVSVFFDHPDITPYIVGGSTAGIVPHMVALTIGVFTRSFSCGGSLVTRRHVLTAAHCIDPVFSNGLLSNSLRGTMGTNRWNIGGIMYQFSSNITHPHYLRSIIKNDIGFLITSSEVSLNNNIQVVPLSYDFVADGVPAVVNGWGRIRGDSGSALVRQSDGQQIGVVSWGLPCARGAPDMYARVSAYRSWIEQSIV